MHNLKVKEGKNLMLEDDIFSALLQNSSDIIITHLVKLFRSYLRLGYIPMAWMGTKVVFIPKVGRTDYTNPASFRPISMTSFLLKTLERLVDRHIKEGIMVQYLLYPLQFAYQAGKLTDATLHRLVTRVENALLGDRSALGTFIDIEGAFDNTSHDSICNALQRQGSEPIVVA